VIIRKVVRKIIDRIRKVSRARVETICIELKTCYTKTTSDSAHPGNVGLGSRLGRFSWLGRSWTNWTSEYYQSQPGIIACLTIFHQSHTSWLYCSGSEVAASKARTIRITLPRYLPSVILTWLPAPLTIPSPLDARFFTGILPSVWTCETHFDNISNACLAAISRSTAILPSIDTLDLSSSLN
jgi:hypothetical protein